MSGERKSLVHYYLESEGHMVFCAPWFRREGLCLFLYNDQELAVAAAAEKARVFGYDIDLGETGDVIDFLRRMAGLGFAGAVLNDLVPVIFCRQKDGTPVFLRSLQNQQGGFSHFERLLDDGTWDVSAEVGGIAPIQDQPLYDRLIGGLIGEIPFRGYHDEWKPMTYSDVATDELPVIDAADGEVQGRAAALRGSRFIPIFSRFEFLEQFVVERGIDPATVMRRDVDDLAGLSRRAGEQEALVLLNPGQHRVDAAALGWRENGVALTSYSGRWFAEDGRRFRRAGMPSAVPSGKSTGPRTLADELALRNSGEGTAAGEAGDGSAEEGIDMVSGVELDTSLDQVELDVTVEQVLSVTLNHALSRLCSAFRDLETLRWAAGRFHFRFDGVEQGSDPFAVPEVRHWLRSLDRLLPVLPYFLSSGEGGQQDVARALLGPEAGGGGDGPHASLLGEYVEDRSLMILALGEKYGIEVREVCEGFADVLSHTLPQHFFIEPDGFDGSE
jgi:hypothetical protein